MLERTRGQKGGFSQSPWEEGPLSAGWQCGQGLWLGRAVGGPVRFSLELSWAVPADQSPLVLIGGGIPRGHAGLLAQPLSPWHVHAFWAQNVHINTHKIRGASYTWLSTLLSTLRLVLFLRVTIVSVGDTPDGAKKNLPTCDVNESA